MDEKRRTLYAEGYGLFKNEDYSAVIDLLPPWKDLTLEANKSKEKASQQIKREVNYLRQLCQRMQIYTDEEKVETDLEPAKQIEEQVSSLLSVKVTATPGYRTFSAEDDPKMLTEEARILAQQHKQIMKTIDEQINAELKVLKSHFAGQNVTVDQTAMNVSSAYVTLCLTELMQSGIEPSVVTLSDGRKLGYKMYGAPLDDVTDSADRWNHGLRHIFLFHGTPGSRHFFLPSWEKLSIEFGVRFHVLERPGFGLSSRHPTRTMRSFSKDVLEYADLQHIQQFCIIGYSAGAPYAAIASQVIPATRLLAVHCCAAIYPCQGASKKMTLFNKLAWNVILKHVGMTKFFVQLDNSSGLKTPAKTCSSIFLSKGTSPLDALLMLDNPVIALSFALSLVDQHLIRGHLEKAGTVARPKKSWYASGSTGEAEDYYLFRNEKFWDFTSLEKKSEQASGEGKTAVAEANIKVFISSGSEDKGSTAQMGRELAKAIPNADFKLFEEKGHLYIFAHFREIVEQLLQ